jgi:hypothetical protein
MSPISPRHAAQLTALDSSELWFLLIPRFPRWKELLRAWMLKKPPKAQSHRSTTTWTSPMALSHLRWKYVAKLVEDARLQIWSQGGQDTRLQSIYVRSGLVTLARSLVTLYQWMRLNLCIEEAQIEILRAERCQLGKIFNRRAY